RVDAYRFRERPTEPDDLSDNGNVELNGNADARGTDLSEYPGGVQRERWQAEHRLLPQRFAAAGSRGIRSRGGASDRTEHIGLCVLYRKHRSFFADWHRYEPAGGDKHLVYRL